MGGYFAETPRSFSDSFSQVAEEIFIKCAQSFVQNDISLQGNAKELIKLAQGRKVLFCISHEKADNIFRIATLCQALAEKGTSVKIWIDSPLDKVNSNYNEKFQQLLKEKKLSDFVCGYPRETIAGTKSLGDDVMVIHNWDNEEAISILKVWEKNGTKCFCGGELWV